VGSFACGRRLPLGLPPEVTLERSSASLSPAGPGCSHKLKTDSSPRGPCRQARKSSYFSKNSAHSRTKASYFPEIMADRVARVEIRGAKKCQRGTNSVLRQRFRRLHPGGDSGRSMRLCQESQLLAIRSLRSANHRPTRKFQYLKSLSAFLKGTWGLAPGARAPRKKTSKKGQEPRQRIGGETSPSTASGRRRDRA